MQITQTLEIIQIILHVIIALGIYNVWFIRPKMSTAYRGRGASTLKQEFDAYGLPSWAIYVIGTLKVAAATALLVGIWYEPIVIPAAAVMAVLMAGAISMHLRVSDPIKKSLPAIGMLVMALAVLGLAIAQSTIKNTQAFSLEHIVYPSSIGLQYVSEVDWPPVATIINKPFACDGDATEFSSETTLRTVNDRTFCRTMTMEGAAGSTYINYTYTTMMPGNTNQTLSFGWSVRQPQCMNYDQPEQSACQADQQNFDPDMVMEGITQSL